MATSEIIGAITDEANAQGVPPEIALAVADKESSFDQSQVGTSGEHGVFQLMPGTASDLKVDPTNLEQNIEGGVRYLKQLNEKTKGDWTDTLSAYNGGIGNLERGTVSDAAKAYPDDVFARAKKYKTTEAKQEEPAINLDVPPTAAGFASVLLQRTNSPDFDSLPFEDKAKALTDIYGAKKWSRDAYPVMKQVMNNLWDGANPDELPNIKDIVGAPPLSKKDAVKETAAWKTQVIQDLLGSGVTPAVFGDRLDQYLDSAAKDEVDAFGVRNESFLSSAASNVANTARDVAKGAVSSFTTPIAGVARLSGAPETADEIQSLPELLGKPRNSYLYETDENGYLKLNDDGTPITRYQSQIAQTVGSVGAFLSGGAAASALGATTKAISVGLFTANALSAGNDIFKDVYDKTGNTAQAYTASLFALPAAAVGSLGEAAVVSKFANPVMQALSPANKVRYLSQVFSRNFAVGAASQAGFNAIEQGGEISQTGQPFNVQDVKAAALSGGLASGVVASAFAKGAPPREPTRLNDIPAPTDEGTPPPPPPPPAAPAPVVRGTVEEQVDIASKLEKFQRSPAQELVLSQDEASKVHPELLNTFALDVAPEGENYILRKRSTYIPVEPAEDIAVLDTQIGKLNKELIKDGTPDDVFGLTQKLSTLKKQYAEVEASIGPTTAATVKARNVLEAELTSKRSVFDEQTDPILKQVAYSELQDAKSNLDTFDSANEAIFELPNKLGELDSQIQETQNQLKTGRQPTFANDISHKQANLEGLIRKRKGLISEEKQAQEEARQKALDKPKPTAEGQAKAAAPIPEVQTTKEIVEEATPEFDHTASGIPVGDKSVVPVNGKWFIFDNDGNVEGTGHDYFYSAAKKAEGLDLSEAVRLGEVERETKAPKFEDYVKEQLARAVDSRGKSYKFQSPNKIQIKGPPGSYKPKHINAAREALDLLGNSFPKELSQVNLVDEVPLDSESSASLSKKYNGELGKVVGAFLPYEGSVLNTVYQSDPHRIYVSTNQIEKLANRSAKKLGTSPEKALVEAYRSIIGHELVHSIQHSVYRTGALDAPGTEFQAHSLFGIDRATGTPSTLSKGSATALIMDSYGEVKEVPIEDSAGAQKATGLKPETIGERLRVSKVLDPRITSALGGKESGALLYKPQSNKESAALASEFISRHGSLAEAAQAFITLPETHTTPESVFAGESLITAFDEVSKSAGARGDTKAADAAASLAFNIADKTSAMLRLAGQTVQAAKVFARLSPESYVRKVEKTLKENNLPGLSEKDKARINELIKAAQETGGTIQQNLLNEVGQIENRATKGAFNNGSSALFSLWQANQLSDPSTQAVNIVGNASQLFGSTVSFLATGLPRGNFDGLAMIKGFAHGALDEGFHAAMLELQGIKTYKPQAAKAEMGSRGPALTRGDFVRDAPKWMQKIGLNNLGYVFRALSAADALFYKTAQEGMGQLAAYNVATDEGLSGASRKNRISELLYDSTKAWDDAAAQAKKEVAAAAEVGVKPSKSLERIRTWEILEQNRPESIRNESLNFASKNTFNNKPEGVLGNLVTGINKFAGTPIKIGGTEVRPFKYLFPFMNIAGNIANASLDYTFVGGYRAAFDGNLSNLERRNTLGKFMLGSVLTGTLYGLSKEFEDDKDPKFALYGSGPKDAQQNKLWRDSGAKPYSIKVGDSYFRYSETPLGILLGSVAGVLDAQRYDKSFNRADLPEAIGIAMSGSLKAFTDNSFLKSIGTVVKAVTGEADAKVLDALFTNPIKGFNPAAGAQRAISKLIQDPIETKNDFYAKIVSGIPWAQGVGTKPALNAFGKPVERSWEDRLSAIGRFYSERVTDEAPRWLAETGYTLPDSGVTVSGSKGLKEKRSADLGAGFASVLTPEERHELVKEAGPLIEQRVLDYKERYGSEYSEAVQEKLNKDIKAIRSRVRRKIIIGAGDED